MTKIEEELRKLPDLSQTVFKLQKMQNNADVEISQVLEVLQENSFVVAKITNIFNNWNWNWNLSFYFLLY